MWYVYILECLNKTLYTGVTNNVGKRFEKHIHGKGANYTKSFGVKRLLYSEKHSTKSKALKREFEIKSLPRSKKLTLIKNKNMLLKKNIF